MNLPKYQWLMTEPEQECGFCDTVYVSQNGTDDYYKQIQVMLTKDEIVENAFSSNPFDLITSTDLVFEIDFTTYGTGITHIPTGKQLQLYCEGKTYIINWALALSSDYEYTLIDNTYFVNILFDITLSGGKLHLRDFLIDVFDVNHGSTTTFNLGTDEITIATIPSGSYISSYDYTFSMSTVTASNNVGHWMYWNGSGICYNSTIYTNKYLQGDVYYSFEQSLTSGTEYVINIPYTITAFGIEVKITIDDGTNPPTEYTPTVTPVNGMIRLNYTALLTTTHTIKIELTEVNENTSGVCFNGLTISGITKIDKVEYEDCDGNINEIEFSSDPYKEYLDSSAYNIELVDQFPDVFRIIITDDDSETIVSRWYKVYSGECEYGKLFDIKWTSDCVIGELRYPFTEQVNQLYLSGVMIKQQLDVVDSIDNITATGKKISIYKNTIGSYELRLHPYLADTMDTIERIFDHNDITIDGVVYNCTDVFQVSEIDLGVYTGRIDLYKDGSELVVTRCC